MLSCILRRDGWFNITSILMISWFLLSIWIESFYSSFHSSISQWPTTAHNAFHVILHATSFCVEIHSKNKPISMSSNSGHEHFTSCTRTFHDDRQPNKSQLLSSFSEWKLSIRNRWKKDRIRRWDGEKMDLPIVVRLNRMMVLYNANQRNVYRFSSFAIWTNKNRAVHSWNMKSKTCQGTSWKKSFHRLYGNICGNVLLLIWVEEQSLSRLIGNF